MKQSDLNRAVAQATGESVRLIQALGFGLVPDRGCYRCRWQRPRRHDGRFAGHAQPRPGGPAN